MSKRFSLAFVLSLILLSTTAFAYPIRCDRAQKLCEVKSRRLTVGDYVGVFAGSGELIAIGRVADIKGVARIVKIVRRYSTIYRSHDATWIEDRKARDPEKFFKVQKPLDPALWSGSGSLLSMGVGDGFVGMEFKGEYQSLWRENTYYTASISYLSASGEASENLKSIDVQSVDLSVIGVTAGLRYALMTQSPLGFRIGGDLGFASVSATVSGGFDAAEVLNDRVVPGTGLLMRALGELIYQRDGIKPSLGVQFYRLQNSNSFGFFLGVSGPLDLDSLF